MVYKTNNTRKNASIIVCAYMMGGYTGKMAWPPRSLRISMQLGWSYYARRFWRMIHRTSCSRDAWRDFFLLMFFDKLKTSWRTYIQNAPDDRQYIKYQSCVMISCCWVGLRSVHIICNARPNNRVSPQRNSTQHDYRVNGGDRTHQLRMRDDLNARIRRQLCALWRLVANFKWPSSDAAAIIKSCMWWLQLAKRTP